MAPISPRRMCRAILGGTPTSTARPASMVPSTSYRSGPTTSRVARVRTRTSRTGNAMRSRQDGFTLVELLAVLVVLALVAGVAATHLGTRHSGEVLQAAAHELASRCRAARAAAIRRASDQTVIIDMANRLV